MQSFNFDSTIFGISITGQGSTNAVEGTHRVVLRDLVSAVVRRLSLRLASWRALKRPPMAMPATMTLAGLTPAMATCLSYSDSRRHQRVQRWRVVETRGTVGVC